MTRKRHPSGAFFYQYRSAPTHAAGIPSSHPSVLYASAQSKAVGKNEVNLAQGSVLDSVSRHASVDTSIPQKKRNSHISWWMSSQSAVGRERSAMVLGPQSSGRSSHASSLSAS